MQRIHFFISWLQITTKSAFNVPLVFRSKILYLLAPCKLLHASSLSCSILPAAPFNKETAYQQQLLNILLPALCKSK